MPPKSTSLATPAPPATQRHATHSLSRSPGRSRGRPRKAPPPPRPRFKDRVQAMRAASWFVPSAVAVGVLLLALFYSAVRIASRQSDGYGTVYNSETPAPPIPSLRTAIGVEKNGRVEILTNDQGNRITPSYVGFRADTGERIQEEKKPEEALDEAVRHALEEAWHLPPHAGEENTAAAVGTGGQPPQEHQRTLKELYEELDELGISPHELQEALDEGLRDRKERA
ncbi:hypothetical protein JCM8547_003452 [Rhodosporidiobolus lusitaniae]